MAHQTTVWLVPATVLIMWQLVNAADLDISNWNNDLLVAHSHESEDGVSGEHATNSQDAQSKTLILDSTIWERINKAFWFYLLGESYLIAPFHNLTLTTPTFGLVASLFLLLLVFLVHRRERSFQNARNIEETDDFFRLFLERLSTAVKQYEE